MKNFRRFLTFILFVSCTVASAIGFSVPQKNIFAATSTSSVSRLTISQFGTYYLYPNGNGISNINNYFGYHCNDENARKTSSTEILEHRTSSKAAGSTYRVGHFFSDIALSQNLIDACKNGAIVFNAQAMLSSESDPVFFDDSDYYVEDVILSIEVGTGTANSYTGFTATASKNQMQSTPRDFKLTQVSDFVPNVDMSFVRFHIYSPDDNWANHIIIKAKQPTLTISTNDATIPYITGFDYDNDTIFAKEKYVYVNVADDGAGINYVTANGAQAQLVSKSADTKTATYKFLANGTQEYNIVVCDNVGNTRTQVYQQTKVDAQVVGNGSLVATHNAGGQDFTFSGTEFYAPNGQTINFVATAAQGNTFVGYSVDGNYSSASSNKFAVVADADKTVVAKFKQFADFSLNKTEYLYTGSDLTVDCTISPEGLDANFTFLQNGEAVAFKNVGSYVLNVSIENDEYIYAGAFDVVINRQVAFEIDDSSVEYNEQAQGIKVTPDCNVNFVVTYSQGGVAVQNPTDAGTYQYSVIVDQQYYFGEASGTFTILPKETQIEISDLVHTYDGTQKQATVSCAVDYTITYNGQTDLPINAGEYQVVVTVTKANYAGTMQKTLTINKRQASIVAHNKQSVYGDELQDLTYTAQNFVSTDGIVANLTCDLQNKVGTYNITIQAIENENYSITYTNGTYTILQRAITVVCQDNQSKIYGDDEPVLKYAIAQGNLVVGDSFSGSIEREPGKDVGQYAITQGTLDNPNYQIEFVDGMFTIVARQVLVQVVSQSKTYGEPDSTFAYTFVHGNFVDDITLPLQREQGEDVGSYTISVQDFENPNYQLTSIDGSLTITAKTIQVVANNVDTTYGTEAELTFQFDQTQLAFEDVLAGGLQRQAGTDVGTYNITIGDLQTSNPNYQIDFVGATYTINKMQLTIDASQNSKIYGQKDGALAYTITEGSLLFDDVLTGTLSREQGETAGQYQIFANTLAHKNYQINLTECYFVINKRAIDVTAVASQKTYGQADGVLTYVATGLKNQDVVSIELYREAGEDAGTYPILMRDFEHSNYYVDNFTSAIFTITNADITCNFEDINVTYDTRSHTIDMSEFQGFNYQIVYKNSNGMQVDAPTNADAYVATVAFANNKNFNDKTVQVNIAIAKQFVAITVEQEIFVFNGKNHYPTYSISKNVNCLVNFENELHSEVGLYDYTIQIDDENFYGQVDGQMEIIAVPFYTNENGDSLQYVSDAFDKDAVVTIQVEKERVELNSAEKTLKQVVTNIDVFGIYSFTTTNNQIINSNYTANIKYPNAQADKIKVFEINQAGYIRQVEFTYQDDMVTFDLCDLNSKIFVTTENEIVKKALIGSGIGLAVLGITLCVVFADKLAHLNFVNKIKARKKKKLEEKQKSKA